MSTLFERRPGADSSRRRSKRAYQVLETCARGIEVSVSITASAAIAHRLESIDVAATVSSDRKMELSCFGND